MPNIHRKHLRHGAANRHRRSSLAAFLTSEATDKGAPERVIRDLFRNIHPTGKTAAQIDAAADATAAGAVVNTITLTAAQKAAVTPTNITFGRNVAAGGATQWGLRFDALTAANTVTFNRAAGTIALSVSNPTTLGFVAGGKISVGSSLNNNSDSRTIRAVSATTITVARATTGAITVDLALGARGTVTRSSGSFLTDGFVTGDRVVLSGCADAANNAEFEVLGVEALVLYLKDLPASETGDLGVTVSTADLRDEVSTKCNLIQYNTIQGIATTNIAAGAILVGNDELQNFEITVDSVAASLIIFSNYRMPGRLDAAGGTVFVANEMIRAAGSWATDGFEAGEGVTVALTVAGVNGNYVLRSVGTLSAFVTTAFGSLVSADTDATVKGRSLLTRAAGSWATDGFALGKLVYLQGTAASGLNDGYWRIGKVVSATVLEVIGATAAETATASVKAFLINEQAR